MDVVTAGAGVSTGRTPSEAYPVYAIEVVESGTDRVARELYRLGCAVVDQRIPGYLVVPMSPSVLSIVQRLRGVLRVFDAAGTDFARPVTVPEPVLVHQVGDFVRVASGPYQNVSGVIHLVAQGTVQLEIVLFGRLLKVSLPAEQVHSIPLPEAWRG